MNLSQGVYKGVLLSEKYSSSFKKLGGNPLCSVVDVTGVASKAPRVDDQIFHLKTDLQKFGSEKILPSFVAM
jgi:hypothetical protein